MTTQTATITSAPSAQSLNGTSAPVITLASLSFNPFATGVLLAHRWTIAQLKADNTDLNVITAAQLNAAYTGADISAYLRQSLELTVTGAEWRVALTAVKDGWTEFMMSLAECARALAAGELKDKAEQVIQQAAPDYLVERAFGEAAYEAELAWAKIISVTPHYEADGPGTSLVTAPPRVNEKKADAKWTRAQCELDDVPEPDWVTQVLGPKGLSLDNLELDPRNVAAFRQLSQILGALSRANRNG